MEARQRGTLDTAGRGLDHQVCVWLEEAEHSGALRRQGVGSNVTHPSPERRLQRQLQAVLP